MKKSLVLAMAMALGVTASAYAANPFSDVPAGHWAYDSLAKLADTGVIDGYPDGTFKGDETITRYEAAQITARAMAKGAQVDKLAAEFASELEALGVKVAALEKNADNLKIAGQIRYEYKDQDGDSRSVVNRLQTRLFLNGAINEDWTYNARLQNRQSFANNNGETELQMNRASVAGKIGGVKVEAGRFCNTLAGGNLYDDSMDAIKASYGKKVNVAAYYGKATEAEIKGSVTLNDKAWGVAASGKIGVVGIAAGYDQFKSEAGEKDKVWNVGVNGNIGKLALGATYLQASVDDGLVSDDASNKGFVVSAKYAGAKGSQVGSWGVGAQYYNQGAGTFLAHTMNGVCDVFEKEGFKGWMIGAEYAVAKNIIALVEYYDLKGKETDDSAKTIYSRLQFSF